MENYKELCKKWGTLLSILDRKHQFDYRLFKEAYLQTFEILQPISTLEAVPKELMDLFCYANDFATYYGTGISAQHDAAGELAGMMLSACCHSCNDTPVTQWVSYDSEKMLPLDQVDEAIAVLAEQYESDYV